MTLFALDPAATGQRVAVGNQACLVGELLAEARDFAGGFLVADRALALDFVHMVVVKEGHRAVLGGQFHEVLQLGGEGDSSENSEDKKTGNNFFHLDYLLNSLNRQQLQVEDPLDKPSKSNHEDSHERACSY